MSDAPSRTLSHWGWGWAERFPPPDERRALAQKVALLLGLSQAPEPREPTALDDARLPPPRDLTVPAALAAIARSGAYDRALRCYGRAWPDVWRGFHGDFASAPDLVLCPRDEDEVEAALRWAAQAHVALIPYGGGTSVVAGVEAVGLDAYRGVATLDLRGLDRLIEVDAHSQLACVEAGMTGPALEAALAPHGLSMRHFPQSFEFSTVGGWIATRSGGHYATLATHIDERVAAVRMVTGAGRYESRCLPASGAGPSPDRTLALGSEGTLGVITRAWLRVVPRPVHRARASVRFARFADGVEAARRIAQSGLYPANCRLLDPREALLFGVSYDNVAILLLAFESHEHAVDDRLAQAVALAEACGGALQASAQADRQEPDGDAHASWRQAFIEAPYLVNAMVSLGMIADTFETACTWSRFEALHRELKRALIEVMRRECDGAGLLTCRFTHVYPDGPAPYYTFVAPAVAGDTDASLTRWATLKRTASEVLAEHGATITHHHAVGRTHRPWYDRQRPEPYAVALRAMKRALDPQSVLNPGVLIDSPPPANDVK